MARTLRVKSDRKGNVYYHLISRTNNQQFLFERNGIRGDVVDALKRAAYFSGVELVAYMVMSNHFHIVCRISKSDIKVPMEEIASRLVVLMGRGKAEKVFASWEKLKSSGKDEVLEHELDRYRVRMNDVSAFAKTFKEMVNIRFKRTRKYCGSIWDGRFKSTIIESGEYLVRCCRYVEFNPVRAGMVNRARDYKWGSAGDSTINIITAAGSVPVAAEDDIRMSREDGCAPELMWRLVQIGAGKIFGSYEFVAREAINFAGKFHSSSLRARRIGNVGFAIHGYRLAAKLKGQNSQLNVGVVA